MKNNRRIVNFINTPGHEPETPASVMAHVAALAVCLGAIVLWAIIITA